MTANLRNALAALERLPVERQDELAESLQLLASAPAGYSADHLAAIDEGLADADAGRFASDNDVAALFARYRVA